MKKILAVLIAIAMVASMAFAADLTASAVVRAKGDILSITDVSKADETFTGITADAPADADYKVLYWGSAGTYLKVSTANADESAGADIGIMSVGDYPTLSASLWIKPVADVKLTFLSAEIKATNDYGDVKGDFGVTYTGIPSLTVDAVTTAAHKKDTSIDFGVKAAYEYNKEAMRAYEEVTLDVAPVTINEKIDFNNLDKDVVMKSEATVSGNAGDVALAVKAEWADLQKADKVKITPSATISGACGAAGWSLGAKLPVDMTGSKTVVGFAIPYAVTMAW